MKLQSFCKTKDTVNKTNLQPIDWTRIFTKIYKAKIYKECKKLDTNKPNNPIKKWGTELKKRILNREILNG